MTHNISYCLFVVFLPCSLLLFYSCCHDPFTMRCLKFVYRSWCHSVCASVSMFMVTDHCLFLFLFLFLFLVKYLNTTRAFELPSRFLHLHRSKPLRARAKSVYVRTTSVYLPMHARPESPDLPRQVSNLFQYPESLAYLCVHFVVLLPIDSSPNSPFLQRSMLSCSEWTFQVTKCCSQSASPYLAR